MTDILQVENLHIRFKQDGAEVHAVRGVSFTIGKGETVALVGESGSGKSVTALSTVALLGDSARIEGSIRYDGKEMVGASEPELRQVRGNDVSFIFQEPMTSLNPLHTIEKQLAESIELHQGLRGPAVRREQRPHHEGRPQRLGVRGDALDDADVAELGLRPHGEEPEAERRHERCAEDRTERADNPREVTGPPHPEQRPGGERDEADDRRDAVLDGGSRHRR